MKLVVILLVLAFIEGSRSACPHKMTSGGFRDVDGCFANRMYFPLCGDDGCTYINQGLLDCVNDKNRNEGDPEVKVVSQGMCTDVGTAGVNNNAAGGAAGGSKQATTTIANNSNNRPANNASGDGGIDLLAPEKFYPAASPNNRQTSMSETPQVQRNNVPSETRKISRTDMPSSGCSLASSSIMVQTTELLSKMSMKMAKEAFKITWRDPTATEDVASPEMQLTSDSQLSMFKTVVAVLLVTALAVIP